MELFLSGVWQLNSAARQSMRELVTYIRLYLRSFSSADIFINSGCYIPASGHRIYNSGGLNSVGTYGYSWSGSPYSNETYGYYLVFGSNTVTPADNYYRANGFPVRWSQLLKDNFS